MNDDSAGQGPVERGVGPGAEARHLPTPEDLRSYADDADEHGNHWVPIAPASLRGLADEIERLRTAVELGCNTLAPGGLYAGLHSTLMTALGPNDSVEPVTRPRGQ